MTDIRLKSLLESYFYMPDLVVWRFSEVKVLSAYYSKYYKNGRILDVGCGDGIFGFSAINKIIDVGIDNNFKELNKGDRENYKYLVSGKAQNIPFKYEKFDFIFSNCVIEHIKELKAALEEIRLVLAPSGKFVFTIPSTKFINHLLFAKLFKRLGLVNLATAYKNWRIKRLTIEHILSLKEWNDLLNEVGLKIVEYKYYISKKEELLFTVFYEVMTKIFPISRYCAFLKRLLIVILTPIIKYASQDSQLSSGMGLCLVVSKF